MLIYDPLVYFPIPNFLNKNKIKNVAILINNLNLKFKTFNITKIQNLIQNITIKNIAIFVKNLCINFK